MSTVLRAPAAAGAVRPFWAGIVVAPMRWWLAYTGWRLERLAIARLPTMSDRQLKVLGIVRSEIDFAVRRRAPSHCTRREW